MGGPLATPRTESQARHAGNLGLHRHHGWLVFFDLVVPWEMRPGGAVQRGAERAVHASAATWTLSFFVLSL